MSIFALSNELVDNILSYLDTHTLFQVALVSKDLNALATPYLYREVEFGNPFPEWGHKFLLPFAYLIFTKPSIASHVYSFSLQGGMDWGEMPPAEEMAGLERDDSHRRLSWPESPDLDDTLHRVVREAAHSDDEAEEWYGVVREGNWESSVLALVLPKLLKLRRLFVQAEECEHGYFRQIFERVRDRQKPFNSGEAFAELTDVMVDGWGDKYPSEPYIFNACLGMPSLQRIYGNNLGYNDSSEPEDVDIKLQLNSLPITEIELRNTKLLGAELVQMLRACKRLTAFIYEAGQAWAWTPLRFSDIRLALTPHEAWLERLCLDHPAFYPYESPQDGEDEPWAISFKDFKVLKQLRVAPVYLFGHYSLRDPDPANPQDDVDEDRLIGQLLEAMPPTLEELHITHSEFIFSVNHLAPAFNALIVEKDERVPELKKLTFEGPFKSQRTWLDRSECFHRLQTLLQVAEAKGITTVVLDDPDDYGGEERGWGWERNVQWPECQSNQKGAMTVLSRSDIVILAAQDSW